MSSVVTRFAPSPTGYLHIGGARTALFNYLFARRHGGKFLVRIEDTDRARSTEPAISAILAGLDWLGLHPDGDVIYQSQNAERHGAVAHDLLAAGKAYHCYCTPDELTAMRDQAIADKRSPRYDGRWRDKTPKDAPAGINPTIRLKMPQDGETVISDHVQGDVRVHNSQLDDMVLLRADGTPTYMLAVVVDDHDAGVTHIIRGDDHLTNAFRQYHLYDAMGWDVPAFAHIPLIHGADGAKLSKRHGALGIDAYQDMGFLPEALENYLLRLGFSHGDDEIISRTQATDWFNLESVGKSPSRFDMKKLESVNAHYMRIADNARLVDLIRPILKNTYGIVDGDFSWVLAGMDGLKQRAKTLIQLADNGLFYIKNRPIEMADEARKILDAGGRDLLAQMPRYIMDMPVWGESDIESYLRGVADTLGVKLGGLAGPLRAALTGRSVAPSVFNIMAILEKQETLTRIQNALKYTE